MKKKTAKSISSIAGAAAMLAASTPMPAVSAEVTENSTPDLQIGTYNVEVTAKANTAVLKASNISGKFDFNQNTISPKDEIFNIFGTAITGMCAKPWFAFEKGNEALGDYFINVSGSMKHSYSVNMNDLKKENSKTELMKCSCSTGAAIAQTYVTGIPMECILSLAELEQGVNTITLTGSDGYSTALPLSCVLNNHAMLVYQVGDEAFGEGRNQFWMPKSVAKYFTRNVVDIKASKEDEPPVLDAGDLEQRAKVRIMNAGVACKLGETIRFEGYADDCGSPIAAVEYSMDGGETWAAFETPGATAERWVYWSFDYTPELTGSYELLVRARTESGLTSPLESSISFAVEQPA